MRLRSLLKAPFLLPAAASEISPGISRSRVIANAATWLNPPVPYSRTEFRDGYRTDCSGYVSMAWDTPINHSTYTLPGITMAIEKENLKSGDILLNNGIHVTIFDGWVDSAKTRYWGFEQVSGKINLTKYWEIPYPYWKNDLRYEPRRYIDITE